jgi:hypothetical protein
LTDPSCVLTHETKGLPKGSPATSPYFSKPQHAHDRYSIAFTFTPKSDIPGDALVFGNDFDHPIRDRLPPLFDKAFGIVKWWIDPGLDGDVNGDAPYLYGALLSSINVLRIGGKGGDAKPKGNVEGDAIVYEEGAYGDGEAVRKELHLPATSAARQKHFLAEQHRKDFTFEAGREYQCDFFNPYLDFNEFALKIGYGLPSISILGSWDGQPLRYVTRCPLANYYFFFVGQELTQCYWANQNALAQIRAQEPCDGQGAVRGRHQPDTGRGGRRGPGAEGQGGARAGRAGWRRR